MARVLTKFQTLPGRSRGLPLGESSSLTSQQGAGGGVEHVGGVTASRLNCCGDRRSHLLFVPPACSLAREPSLADGVPGCHMEQTWLLWGWVRGLVTHLQVTLLWRRDGSCAEGAGTAAASTAPRLGDPGCAGTLLSLS